MPRKLKKSGAVEAVDGVAEHNDPLFVTALARGLDVLKCCASAETDLTVSEIAKLLGLPQSTVWRCCHTLERQGYLERTPGERLRPGLALLGLGHAALSRQPMAALARPGMAAIATRFLGAVSLGIPQGMEMLYLARVEGGATIYPGLSAGSRVGVLSSAMGWAWLAALSPEARMEFVDRARRQAREQYERIADQLEEAIGYYETHGVLVNSGVIHPELNAIAVPILSGVHSPIASISFGGVQAAFPAERLLKEVAPGLVELASNLSHCRILR